MNSREEILNALRRNAPATAPPVPIPRGIEYGDPIQQFEKVFTSVGGHCIHVEGDSALSDVAGGLDVVAKARQVASRVDAIASRGIDVGVLDDPHQLGEVDVAILPAEFGVAENGAAWISGSSLGRHRAIFVIAQHLVLVLNRREIVSNMHQAYERVSMERPGFGLFLSGPSKTADIEQSLVIGAHGARSCTVLLL